MPPGGRQINPPNLSVGIKMSKETNLVVKEINFFEPPALGTVFFIHGQRYQLVSVNPYVNLFNKNTFILE